MKTRQSARAVALDSAGNILLSKVHAISDSGNKTELWVTLGGRMNEGEDARTCLQREIQEELGLADIQIDAQVWLGDEQVVWNGQEIRLLEHFFPVRLERTDYAFFGSEDAERLSTLELRWWPSDEIKKSDARFIPVALGELLAQLNSGAVPDSPQKVALEEQKATKA